MVKRLRWGQGTIPANTRAEGMEMKASLHTLLENILDYAGLFPPARLPLEQAIRNYAAYRQQPEAWMLARFVCPAERLAELSPYVSELFSPPQPLPLSVLAGSGNTLEESAAALTAQLQAMRTLLQQEPERVRIDALELRLPEPVLASGADALADLVHRLDSRLQQAGLTRLQAFYEVPLRDSWQRDLAEVALALRELNEARRLEQGQAGTAVGIKLRTGGLEAAAFPTPDQVTYCLRHCLENRLPFKATAGLHHPLRRWDASLRTYMHGFLNVFAGGVLTYTCGLNGRQLRELLIESDPQPFLFEADGLRWRDCFVRLEQMRWVREHLLISFGSCSFTEPCADLTALGWL